MNRALDIRIKREIYEWEGNYGKKVKYIGEAAEVGLPRFMQPDLNEED
jgi:hypothetical protein